MLRTAVANWGLNAQVFHIEEVARLTTPANIATAALSALVKAEGTGCEAIDVATLAGGVWLSSRAFGAFARRGTF